MIKSALNLTSLEHRLPAISNVVPNFWDKYVFDLLR